MLRRTIVLLALCALLSVPAMAGEWTGWITDEHCAAKGASEGHKSCALKCHEGGAALVFFDPANEKVYKIDDQKTAKEHVGHKVKVTGEADGDSIKVTAIAKAE